MSLRVSVALTTGRALADTNKKVLTVRTSFIIYSRQEYLEFVMVLFNVTFQYYHQCASGQPASTSHSYRTKTVTSMANRIMGVDGISISVSIVSMHTSPYLFDLERICC